MPIESIQQLLAWQPAYKGFVIDQGILPLETRLVIFGSPKAWKSILSIHTAFTIALGLNWFGHKTERAAVLLFQVELPKGEFKKRVLKYSNNVAPLPSNLFFETSPYAKLDTSYGLAGLEKSILDVQARAPNLPVVIILDPAYKLMQGNIADEQDTKRFTDNIDTLRIRYGVTTIIVHHSRKIHLDSGGKVVELGSEDMYGGELQKWCDTAIGAKLLNPFAGKDSVRLSFDLVRNAETLLSDFEVKWSRQTLHPEVTRVITPEPDEPPTDLSVRNLA